MAGLPSMHLPLMEPATAHFAQRSMQLGVKVGRTILQLQTGQGFTDDYYAKIAPSIVYEWSDKMNFQLGLVQGLTGDKGAGLKFETWLTY
jgi:hypothetical protein